MPSARILSIVRIISTRERPVDPASRPPARPGGAGKREQPQARGACCLPCRTVLLEDLLAAGQAHGIPLHVEVLVGGRNADISNLHVRIANEPRFTAK